MLEYIKNTFLGSRLFQRTSSVEPHSKRRQSIPKRKPCSFDSKQKEQKDALLTSQRNQRPEVIVHDQTATIKKYSYSKDCYSKDCYSKDCYSKDCVLQSSNDQDFAIVSDIDDHWHSLGQRNFALHEHSDEAVEGAGLDFGINGTRQTNVRLQLSNLKNSALMKSSVLPQAQSKGKILISRQRSAKKVKRIGQKCVICEKKLNTDDSFQLACSHRCHHQCGKKMQWRMRYKCDACEVKKDYNRCSLIISMRRRNNQK